MNKLSLVKRILLLVPIVFLASCDKEFNTIGSDIVGNDYFQFDKATYEVKTNNYLTGPVQTNNLTLNSLGTYTDPAFGTTTSHFVTQAELQVSNVTVNTNPVIDSVWVYVPFYSTDKGTNADGTKKYELDSVYPAPKDVDLTTKKFKLKVYENGYYLGTYNPNNTGGAERHFSDEKGKVENVKLGADANNEDIVNGAYLNNSADTAENEEFFFSNKERIIYKTNGSGDFVNSSGDVIDPSNIEDRVVKERFVPGIWLNLNKEYFENKILKAPASKLANNNAFKEYFRGLYFKVESNGGEGAMASLDFTKGYIKMTYKMDQATDDDNDPTTPTATRLKRYLVIKLGGNCVNFFDSSPTLAPNPMQRLRLKGGNGSAAYIDLFGEDGPDAGTVPDELETLRANGWMINEANLTFYVDGTLDGMGKSGQIEPNRIYLYDYKNKRPVVDYYADGSTNSANPKYNKRGFGGIIEKDANGNGFKYKVRVTEYIKSLIKHKDSTNYRLGIAVSENINLSTNAYRKPASGQPTEIIPLSSVLSPLGTILYGPESEDPEKRLKLEIYYTKPD